MEQAESRWDAEVLQGEDSEEPVGGWVGPGSGGRPG